MNDKAIIKSCVLLRFSIKAKKRVLLIEYCITWVVQFTQCQVVKENFPPTKKFNKKLGL